MISKSIASSYMLYISGDDRCNVEMMGILYKVRWWMLLAISIHYFHVLAEIESTSVSITIPVYVVLRGFFGRGFWR
jgi:hypothetical protein